jgi:hypothetical protein
MENPSMRTDPDRAQRYLLVVREAQRGTRVDVSLPAA